MAIDISNRQKILPIKIKRLTAQARKILDALGYSEAELSLVLVDDAEISRLNKEYLNREGPTNVISFAMKEGSFSQINPELLGDVVMSVETAAAEAEKGRLTLEEMLDFYLIHGILHLVGYDHEGSPKEAARMEAKSKEMWRTLGY
ncbi:MAG: rRNA maturation RNase YbeY [Deltaproteobacteria bacterium]|nr:rRNA maturation RNase YbeY [Deltaproteobacteria bacterium]MBW2084822.1 rRNA maturation RNase YbeY [Deltaproteobacteria bacterium]